MKLAGNFDFLLDHLLTKSRSDVIPLSASKIVSMMTPVRFWSFALQSIYVADTYGEPVSRAFQRALARRSSSNRSPATPVQENGAPATLLSLLGAGGAFAHPNFVWSPLWYSLTNS